MPSARPERCGGHRALDQLNCGFGERGPNRYDAFIWCSVLKRAAEFLLARGGPAALAARRRRGSTLILAYHNVVPDDAPPVGDRSLHLPLARFRSQLNALQETHDIVALEEVRGAPVVSARPRVAITFDDAYRGALTLALPELARRKIPATVFVAPGLLGSEGCWWDLLAARDGSGLSASVRNHVLTVLRGDDAAAVAWARTQATTHSALPPHARIATEDELRLAAALPGIMLGAHTWSHCNLAQVSRDALDAELAKPLRWLQERFANVLPWLAYPYGLSAPSTAEWVRHFGYRGAFRIEGGWINSASPPEYVLPRINIPAGLSRDGFVLRVSGLTGS